MPSPHDADLDLPDPSDVGHRLSDAMAELSGLLLHTESFQAVMQQLAATAPRLVPGLLTAGITVADGGRILTVASTDALGELLDERQFNLDEGPCLQSMRTNKIVDIPDMSAETRWGSYPAQVRVLGVEAIHSIPLATHTQTVGVLNLYAGQPHAFRPQPVLDAAQQLADLITMAITATLRNYGDAAVTDQLQQSLASRSVIDQAIGILVGTQHCSPTEAFAILRGAAQTTNVRLHQVAQDLLDRSTASPANTPPPA